MNIEFRTLGFDPSYRVEVDPEFPGDGDWGLPLHQFNRDGSRSEVFESRWGTPFVVRVEAAAGSWVGMFASGGLGGASGAFACPATDQLSVLAEGLAYLIDTSDPAAGSIVIDDTVRQVVGVGEPPLLLFVGDLSMLALGTAGIAWQTPRLAVNDLRVEQVSQDGIVCACDNLGASPTIVLDPGTGRQTSGTRLDSFWPPGASM